MLIGKQRVTAFRRQFLRMQQRAQAGPLFVRQVGMPEVARIAQADGLAVLTDVRHDQHWRMPRQLKLALRMNLQRPKALAEAHMLVRGDALIAENQHVVRQMRAVDACKVFVGERYGKIQPHHLGPKGAGEAANVETLMSGGCGAKVRRAGCNRCGVKQGGHGAIDTRVGGEAVLPTLGASSRGANDIFRKSLCAG